VGVGQGASGRSSDARSPRRPVDVALASSAPGLAEFEAELIAFPNAEHDDLVDAAGYAADVGGVEFSFGSARR
jgi:hypothetical protein